MWVWFQSLMTWQRRRKSPCLKFCSSDLISLTACLRDNLRFQLFLFMGRFLSKSDVGLKNLISSPTSSPHKTISFLPPTAFYLERALYSPQNLYMLFSLLEFLVYTQEHSGQASSFSMQVALLHSASHGSMGRIVSLPLNSPNIPDTGLDLVMVCLLAPLSPLPSSQ